MVRSLGRYAAFAACFTRATPPLRARLGRAAAVSALALATGACSVSYPLYGSDKDDIKTGSIDGRAAAITPVPRETVSSSPLPPPPGASAAAPQAAAATPAAYAPTNEKPAEPAGLNPADWAYARGALSIAMGAEANNASIPWANPDSSSYGSFSATAGATVENGATCRAFTASHSAGGHEQRLEGNACRTAAGYWEAVSIHPASSRAL